MKYLLGWSLVISTLLGGSAAWANCPQTNSEDFSKNAARTLARHVFSFKDWGLSSWKFEHRNTDVTVLRETASETLYFFALEEIAPSDQGPFSKRSITGVLRCDPEKSSLEVMAASWVTPTSEGVIDGDNVSQVGKPKNCASPEELMAIKTIGEPTPGARSIVPVRMSGTESIYLVNEGDALVSNTQTVLFCDEGTVQQEGYQSFVRQSKQLKPAAVAEQKSKRSLSESYWTFGVDLKAGSSSEAR